MQAARMIRASATPATTTAAAPKTLKALNITKRTLIDSNGGRAVRNVDSEIYELVYVPANDSVVVQCKSQRKEYQTEVGKDNRISIILESAQPLPGPPTFQELQAVLKFDGPGPERINGRVAMVSVLATAAAELATGRTLLEQAASPVGLGAAVLLMAATTAASLAPAYASKVRVDQALPSVNDTYPDRQLPYFWTALAETLNARMAMIGMAGILINEAIRGSPVF